MSDQQGQQYGGDQKAQEMAAQQMAGDDKAKQADQMAQSQSQSYGKDQGQDKSKDMGGQYMDMGGDKSKDSSYKGKSGGGDKTIINNNIIIIASNAGGSSQTQQLAAPVQPPATTHTVTVGGADAAGKPMLMYMPDSIMAAKYDMVQFNFMAKNHTLTQSTFPAPCKKMMPMAPAAGMPAMPAPVDSGFMPFDGKGMPPMTMMQVVDDKTPMWFYCKQKKPKSHCGAGMTFSINPNMPGQGDKTQAAFKAAAMMQAGGMMGAAMASGVTPPPAGAAMASGMAPPAGAAMASGMMPPAAGSTGTPPAAAAAAMPPPGAAAAAPPPAVAGGDLSAGGASSSQAANSALMAQGTGQTTSGGTCECSCLCGVGSFPNAMQGVGMMGGGLAGMCFLFHAFHSDVY